MPISADDPFKYVLRAETTLTGEIRTRMFRQPTRVIGQDLLYIRTYGADMQVTDTPCPAGTVAYAQPGDYVYLSAASDGPVVVQFHTPVPAPNRTEPTETYISAEVWEAAQRGRSIERRMVSLSADQPCYTFEGPARVHASRTICVAGVPGRFSCWSYAEAGQSMCLLHPVVGTYPVLYDVPVDVAGVP